MFLIVVLCGSVARAEAEPIVPDVAPFEISATERLTVNVAHGLSRSDARERVTQLLAYWAKRFGVKSTWQGFRVFLTGNVLGFDIQALFEVGETEVIGFAHNPGMLVSSSIHSYVDGKLRKYLHPTYQEP